MFLGSAFAVVERRSHDPVIPPRLLRIRGVAAGNAVVLLAGLCVDGLLLLSTRYSQQVLGAGPLAFGVIAAVMTVTSVAGVAIGQNLVSRFGIRVVSGVGMTLMITAGTLLTQIGEQGVTVLVVGMALFGPGMGMAFVAGQIACLAQVSEADAGTASGLEETSFAVGTTLGTAVASATLTAAATAAVSTGAVGTAFAVVSVAALLGLPVSRLLPHVAAVATPGSVSR
ncbi:MFS transporter [Gordonia sp. PKS22-38]|uniref:MFS transporter n=1 Tax=Gordonia prachuapensis TaxID=3115651 RepID=A0ABU7MY77_9ACTN|nr:MFS transporter [Gordonia sp. PKS22-38]